MAGPLVGCQVVALRSQRPVCRELGLYHSYKRAKLREEQEGSGEQVVARKLT